jgi:flagella basal body P-ring formation protein FlgA
MIGLITNVRQSAVALIALAMSAGQAFADPAIVHLKRSVSVDHDVVVLGDVAEVTAGTAALERRLKSLDLLDRENAADSETVSARHVQARLLIAGIDRKSITVTGAPECEVSFGTKRVVQTSASTSVPAVRTNTPDDLVAQAVESLAKVWLASPEDVDVKVVSSPSESQGPIPGATPELELPAKVEPGRVQARIRWLRDGRIERTDQFTFEARLRQTIVLAAHSVERGVPIRPQDLVEDRRMMSTRVDQVRAEQVVGLVARRGLSQGDQISIKDLAAPRTTPMVQARNGVKVVARKGNLAVTLQMAEALEPGNKGDVIRLRNLQSGQIISGRVVSSQQVEIPLD